MDNRQRQKRNKAQQFYDHILSARIGAVLEKHIKRTKNILVCTNPKAHQGKQECARRVRQMLMGDDLSDDATRTRLNIVSELTDVTEFRLNL